MLLQDAMMMVIICSVAFHCTEQAALHALQKYKDIGKRCLMTDWGVHAGQWIQQSMPLNMRSTLASAAGNIVYVNALLHNYLR